MEGFTRDGVTVVCTGDRGCKEERRVGALEENWKQDEVSVSSLNLGIERMGSPLEHIYNCFILVDTNGQPNRAHQTKWSAGRVNGHGQ